MKKHVFDAKSGEEITVLDTEVDDPIRVHLWNIAGKLHNERDGKRCAWNGYEFGRKDDGTQILWCTTCETTNTALLIIHPEGHRSIVTKRTTLEAPR